MVSHVNLNVRITAVEVNAELLESVKAVVPNDENIVLETIPSTRRKRERAEGEGGVNTGCQITNWNSSWSGDFQI